MAVVWALLLLIVLPAGIFSIVFGALAIAAVPLTILLMFLMPRRWARGLPALTLFLASMLLAPVLMMFCLMVGALAEKPLAWEPIEWRVIAHTRLPGDTWRHLFPVRPSREAAAQADPEE
ncbi:MAG: hypothetical protein JWR10_4389 [Rubritepida sp.]|nr:hypothetical protein [Rubritepida sp.]